MLRHPARLSSMVLAVFFAFAASAFSQTGCDAGALRPFDQAPVNGNPVPVSSTQPTIIEAENFDCGGEGVAYHDMTSTNDAGAAYRQSAVDIADITGGQTVRFFDTGEWMTYQINVTTSGVYSLAISAAQNATPAQYRIEIDNNDFTGPVTVTSTGSWDVYQWFVAPNNVQLNAGMHTLKLDSVQQSYRVDQLRIVPVSTPTSSCDTGTLRPFDQSPVNGNPVPVSSTQPTIIEAENFDCGGEGVAYHDMTSTNDAGSAYRQSAVDIADILGGHTIRFFDTGEWMTYQINVAASGTYSLAISAAQNATPAQYRIEIDNSDLTGPVAVTSTGSWDTYQWFAAPNNIQLSAGTHTLKLDSVQQSYRVDQLRIVPVNTPPSNCDTGTLRPFDQSPVNGNPVPVSSTQATIIEAENFDCGGEGVAYHDMTATNDAGSTYRQSAVDIADIAGGHTIRFFDTGEWMTYQINVATSGTYSLAISAAQNATPAQYRIEIDNSDLTGPVAVTSTGSWDVYQWFAAPNSVQLNAGTHTLKLDSVQQSYRVDQLRIVPVGTQAQGCGTADFCIDFEAAPNTQFDCIDFPCTADQNQVRMQSLGNTITGEAQNHADPFPPGDRAADTTRIALVDGGRNGGKAIQLTTLDNDSDVHSSGSMERSEVSFLQADTGAVEGADTWWAHSLFVPLNSTLPSATDDSAGVFQFHGSGGGAPNFILSIMNQTGNNPHKVFRAYTGGNGGLDSVGTQYMYTIDGNTRIGECIYDDFQQGVWYDFVYHIKWSSNGTGRHEIWMRKGSGPVTKVLDKSGISTLYAGDSAYLKFGVYHDPVVGANTSVIHDRIRRGSSADAVRMPDFVIDPNATVTQCTGVAP